MQINTMATLVPYLHNLLFKIAHWNRDEFAITRPEAV